MLAEELVVLNADAPFWDPIRPLLKVALRLEQNETTYSWHGWKKQMLEDLLASLPAHCALVVGVWKTMTDQQEDEEGHEALALSCVCEIVKGQVRSLRTFEALTDAGLPPIQELEPGYEHACEIMRVVRMQ
ncbi:MAG: hypothetical protein J2P37_18010, partial [Ktedonobacteraceae bacterium]|nr:hypothetical protein [Ktedonobacteraceae bacterium]